VETAVAVEQQDAFIVFVGKRLFEPGRVAGAIFAKLLIRKQPGAGGGFLMFYAEDMTRLRQALTDAGLTEVRFRFDFEGTKTIIL
jgi:D-glycero-alpha-D-manno-heptose-7-phosphate kinase